MRTVRSPKRARCSPRAAVLRPENDTVLRTLHCEVLGAAGWARTVKLLCNQLYRVRSEESIVKLTERFVTQQDRIGTNHAQVAIEACQRCRCSVIEVPVRNGDDVFDQAIEQRRRTRKAAIARANTATSQPEVPD